MTMNYNELTEICKVYGVDAEICEVVALSFFNDFNANFKNEQYDVCQFASALINRAQMNVEHTQPTFADYFLTFEQVTGLLCAAVECRKLATILYGVCQNQ